MFVNGMVFFITVSSKIKHSTIEYATSMTQKMTLNYLASVFQLYNKRGFCIGAVLGDPQFDPMKQAIEEKFITRYNPTSANEHVAEVEQQIRVVKERIRATLSSFPWKKAIPRIMVKEVAKHVVMMLNAIPPKSGITTHLSPRNIVSGKTINYKHHF